MIRKDLIVYGITVTGCMVAVFACLMGALIHATRKSHRPFQASYVMPSHGVRRHRWAPRHVGAAS